MAVVPVKGAGLGEVGVLRARVGSVADECVYPCFVGSEPAGVKVANYGGCVDEVGPVEALVLGLRLENVNIWLIFCSFHASLCLCGEERKGEGCLLVIIIVRVTEIRSGVTG